MLLLTVAFSGPLDVFQGHAQFTGEVCLADPTAGAGSSTPCPSSPPVLDGVPGQQIRVGVFIQGSDGLNGFNVVLLANHTALAPVGVDLSGSVLLGQPTIVVECLRGILVVGSVCSGNDTIDTLDFAVAGGLGLMTATPTTGLLFTAIYNVTGTTAPGGIPFGYRTRDCNGTSVPGICITIPGNNPSPNPETAQGATFDDSTPPPSVTVSANHLSFGPEFPGTANIANITATAGTNYPTFGATDAVTFTTAATSGLTATLAGTNPCVTNGASCSVNLTLSAAAPGNYFVTVSGTYATTDSLGNPDTLASTVKLGVAVDDFGFTISPTTISFGSGLTGTATITLTGLNGFAGTVTISSGTIIPPTTPPLTISYSPASVTLTAGATMTSTATFSASPATAVNYHAQIKATSGTRVKTSTTLNIPVSAPRPDFAITASPQSVPPVAVGVQGSSSINVTYVNGLTGSVALSTVTSSPNLACSLNPPSLSGTGTSTLSCSGSSGGSYTANVTGTGPSTSHSVVVGFTILQGPDFNVTASPTIIGPIDAGASGTSNITVNALRGFTGTVDLSATTSSGLTASISPTSITGDGTAILTVSASLAGDYTVTVTASNSTTSHSTLPIQVKVVDFGLTANPTTLNIPQGDFQTSSIAITAQNGFASAVSLSVVGSPGLTPIILPASISGLATAVLNVTSSNSIAPGTYSVNVTGVSGALTHMVEVLVTVPPNDFTIVASPSTIAVAVNADGTSTITLSSLASFAGTITLSVSLPTGVSGSLNAPSVTLVKGGTAVSTLTVNASIAGSFLVNVTGTSGSLVHTITVHVVAAVPDFDLTSSTTSVSVNAGAQGAALITVSPVNAFTGTVALATSIAPATSLTCTLTPSSIVLGSSQTSTLSCGGSAGVYDVTVTGTSGSISHSAIVTYTVSDFTISPSLTAVTTTAGTPGTSVISVAPVNGFAGTIALTSQVSPAGLTCALSPASIVLGASQTSTLSCSGAHATYTVTVTGTSGSLSHSVVVTYTVTDFNVAASPTTATVNVGVAGVSTITIDAVNGFAGTVSLSQDGGASCSLSVDSITLTANVASGSAVLTCSYSVPGDTTVTVTGVVGSLSHSAGVAYVVTDFSLSDSSATLVVAEGQSGVVLITVQSVNGFAGTVDLSFNVTTNVPASLQPSVSLEQYSITLTGVGAGSIGVSTLNATVGLRAYPSSYLIKVNATSGTLHDQLSIVLTVPRPDFSITVGPPANTSAIVIAPGGTGVASFALAGLDGFNGSVTFSSVVSPATGLTCTFSKTSASLVSGGTNSTTLSCHGSVGSYGVTISGVAVETYANGVSHNANVGYSVVDFTISATPTGILVNTDQQAHAAINVTWAHGYSGTVTITVVPSSNLLAVSVSPSTITGGSSIVTLTVSSSVAGDYSVVVNATGGGTFHTVTVTVSVTSVSNTSNIFGVDPAVFYSIIGVLVVAIVGGLVALSRRGKRPKK